ncbi:hypothetical protein SAY87_016685 [Trapa incisa]|uniref:DUF3527 domain-containing protein n=1 Tax=Trapa incisa TaxID=236973 RepID=A0AAN7L9P5_9MYRT|nr:hypothetical protein SAY87_016685 [Trapa incisa]
MKFGEWFIAENSNLIYADLHYKITKDAEEQWPSSKDDQKRTLGSTDKDDELVRYMSNLPGYLKNSENIKEKAYSIGVLDWECLERWQHMHKQTIKSSKFSTSHTSISTSHPTVASSSHSSRSHSCSPVNHRMPHHTVLPYSVASPDLIGRQTTKSTGNNAFAVNESRNLVNNSLWHRKKIEERKKREHNSKMFQKIEKSPSLHMKGDLGHSFSEEKAEIQLQDYGHEKTNEGLEKSNTVVSGNVSEGQNRVVILTPINISGGDKLEVSQLPDPTASSNQKASADSSQGSNSTKLLDIHHSEFDSKFSRVNKPISIGEGPTKLSSDVIHHLPASGRAPVTPRRSKNLEMRTVASLKDDAVKSSKGVNTKSGEKVRSLSPLRRFSMGLGKIVKSYSSKEPDSPESSLVCNYRKSCAENLESPASVPARSRSSPLRRMLEPLLKPKDSNCGYSDNPLKKNSEPINRVSTSSIGQPDPSAVILAKAKLDITSCGSINVDNSQVEKKGRSSMVQALLQVAFKNDLPLFTFAVKNNGDVLAAAVKERNSSSCKGNQTLIYTFLMIREVKKKSASWINQGGKGKGKNYVPNVVAQMKVSISPLSNLREFVLFSVEPKNQNQHTSEFLPNNELAAIVSHIPLRIYPYSVINQHQGSLSEDVDQDASVNMTVILPSGVHSLPSTGGPSSLIQRWRSGGSCDCGGWDLGCQMKVLSGDHHLREKLTSKSPPVTGHFALFPQLDAQENRPEFALAPFKDDIYSVEFNSSLSVLQAFSMSIAALESIKMIGSREDQNLNIGKCLGETSCSPNGDIPTEAMGRTNHAFSPT